MMVNWFWLRRFAITLNETPLSRKPTFDLGIIKPPKHVKRKCDKYYKTVKIESKFTRNTFDINVRKDFIKCQICHDLLIHRNKICTFEYVSAKNAWSKNSHPLWVLQFSYHVAYVLTPTLRFSFRNNGDGRIINKIEIVCKDIIVMNCIYHLNGDLFSFFTILFLDYFC